MFSEPNCIDSSHAAIKQRLDDAIPDPLPLLSVRR
jgi:hypothetical protein